VEGTHGTKFSRVHVLELTCACAQCGDDILGCLDLPLSCAPSCCVDVAQSARSSSVGKTLPLSKDGDTRLDAGGSLDASGAIVAGAG
jgi:hypothetical protein